jgi:hypothetical protein
MSFNHGGHDIVGQVLAAREDRQRRLQGQTLTRLTGGLPFDLQEQIGDEVRQRRLQGQTLTRLTGELPFDLQEQIGDEVRVRRAGERIARFGQRQMRVPFVQGDDPDEQRVSLQTRLEEARQEGGFFVGASFPGSNPSFRGRARLIRPVGFDSKLLTP